MNDGTSQATPSSDDLAWMIAAFGAPTPGPTPNAMQQLKEIRANCESARCLHARRDSA